MTDQELKDLAAENLRAIRELREYQMETARQMREADREMRETDRELRQYQQETARQMKETDHKMKETDRKMKETDRKMKETDRKMKETARQIKELGAQIGGLGRKFGGFTEGMAYPSMEKVLREVFKMEVVSARVEADRDGGKRHEELDILAWANDLVNAAVVVEVKSHLRDSDVERTVDKLERFFEFFPEHKGKKLMGIIAAVDVSRDTAARVFAAGLHLARISGETFSLLKPPRRFQPRDFAKLEKNPEPATSQ